MFFDIMSRKIAANPHQSLFYAVKNTIQQAAGNAFCENGVNICP